MSDNQVVSTLARIMSRTGIGYSELAAGAGVSPGTARHVAATGKLPSRESARAALEAFARRNAGAVRRCDLRFV